jgi:SulP family sulfate permease
MRELLLSAFIIAFLAGVESLLSAMVADGMTGRRHRSNCEIVAQGVANIVSPLFGGISATGAVARTATNMRADAQTPFAGMAHAAFVLNFMLGLGPLIARIPLASLAAVLAVVAWNMSERERFRQLLLGLSGDRIVLLATFLLTVLVDLALAIEVGVVLAAIIFMHRMAEATAVARGVSFVERDQDDFEQGREAYQARAELPAGVELFELRGPLFFGAASRLNDAFDAAFPPPCAFVLRFRDVPLGRRFRHRGAGALLEAAPRTRCCSSDLRTGACGSRRTVTLGRARAGAHSRQL